MGYEDEQHEAAAWAAGKARRFRKKPVEIVAWRVPEDVPTTCITEYLEESIALANWCGGVSYMMLKDDEVSPYEGIGVAGPHIVIETLEGPHAALPGDYIIKGVAGEFYPCKPDIFAGTYDEVVEGEAPDPTGTPFAKPALERCDKSRSKRAQRIWPGARRCRRPQGHTGQHLF